MSTLFSLIINLLTIISGYVTCDGTPIEGVTVSDGVEVVRTDKEGHYSIESENKYGYVFISIPGGYMCETDGSAPLFWQKVMGTSDAEEHSFRLVKEDNSKHRVLVSTDYHLADRKRSKDLQTFQNTFIKDIKEQASIGIPTYGIALGDVTWDIYWKNYSLHRYAAQAKEFPMTTFNVMGNHDNDMDKEGDFDAEQVYRDLIGPTFYSFNIGQCHYVVLDNTIYINKNRSRSHDTYVSQEQLDWLAKDLENVPADTPVFICMHSAAFRVKDAGKEVGKIDVDFSFSNTSYEKKLGNILKGHSNVHILTGDTHINQSFPPSVMPKGFSNVYEHNIAAASATWWWTTYLNETSICKDGSEGGYMVFDNDKTDITWRYKTMKYDFSKQFRSYDFNTVKEYFDNNEMVPAFFNRYPHRERYNDLNENMVLINIWNWDPNWTIKVTENGTELPVTQHHIEDPLHTISYDIPRTYKNGEITRSFRTIKTHHIFSVQTSGPDSTLEITVTDPFGNISKETMTRPKAFSTTMD